MKKYLVIAILATGIIFGAKTIAIAQIQQVQQGEQEISDGGTTPPSLDSGNQEFSEGSADGEGTGEETTPGATDNDGFGVGVALPGGQNDFNGFSDWMTAFYEFSIRLGAILTILMLIFSGYRYMTSQGNPSAINEAKDIMIGSLSGFALLLLVNLVINFIGTTNP